MTTSLDVIARVSRVLETEYVALVGPNGSGIDKTVNALMAASTPTMLFLPAFVPAGVKHERELKELLVERLVAATEILDADGAIKRAVQAKLRSYEGFSADTRLRHCFEQIGRLSPARATVVVLHPLEQVPRESVKSLLLALRDYHPQRRVKGTAGEKLRFLIAGHERTWDLCAMPTPNDSPFNIAEPVFHPGTEDGAFAQLRERWAGLDRTVQRVLVELAGLSPPQVRCEPHHYCPEIPADAPAPMREAFWQGFLALGDGHLKFQNPAISAFVRDSAVKPEVPMKRARGIRTRTAAAAAPMADVLIVVAADGEDTPFANVDRGAAGAWEPLSGTGYDLPIRRRTYRALDGGLFSVALTRAASQRSEATTAAATRLVGALRPLCLAMSGVCAGRPGWATLGDVIVADRLYRYGAGRRTEDKESGRKTYLADTTTFNLHHTWKQAAEELRPEAADWLRARPVERDTQENWVLLELGAGRNPSRASDRHERCRDWREVLRELWRRKLVVENTLELSAEGARRAQGLHLLFPDGLPAEPTPQVRVGPLGTGDDLVAESGIWEELETVQGTIRGLDMEASAIGVVAALENVPRAIVMKGVMDYADPERQYGFRTFAARAAAEVMMQFLREQMPSVPEFQARRSRASTTPG
ncbi:MAG: hypothetical protein Q8P41_27895 [Pseudomonadota bacterium]|nr:hypothetical protein [Pseudomonadota bacterium]